MSTSLLLISHEGIASNLLSTAAAIINQTPDNIDYVEVPMDSPVDKMRTEIQNKLDQLSNNEDTIILTDIYGGTPSNLASCFVTSKNIQLISGLNLAMIIKALNYRALPLNELIEKIIQGGQQSIARHNHEHPTCF